MRLGDVPNQGPAVAHCVSTAWRVLVRTYWLVSAWNYRRLATAQNRHAKAVTARVAELTDLAHDADERARKLRVVR